jgi:histidine ammonia-lyase
MHRIGEALPEDFVRAIMLLRINTLTRGYSGISLNTLTQLGNYLNLGIHPVIPRQGSVGASGDLCPLSHLAITLIGLGDVVYQGKKMPTSEALNMTGLKPVDLCPKRAALNNARRS